MAVKILLAIVLAAMAVAQPVGSGVISGTVVDAASSDPVRKAVVTLTWQGTPRCWATLRTDESGQFQFEGLPPGKYDLRAAKAGVGAAIYGAESVRELGDFLSLGNGETLSGLKLRFVHSASISGRVFDPQGDLITGAIVNLLRPGRSFGNRVMSNYERASTNDRGEYRFSGIDPGEYFARATPTRSNGFRQIRNGVADPPQEISLGVYYGGARQSKDARPLIIRGGENLAGIDFHLVSGQSAQVHGRVLGVPEASAPEPETLHATPGDLVGLRVSSLGEELPMQSFGIGTHGPDSSFDLPEIPAGRYRVQAMMPTEGKPLAATQVFDLHPGANQIELSLMPAIELKGQVHFEGPAAPPAGRFQVTLSQPDVRGSNIGAPVGKDGHFALPQVFPGEWEIDVNVPRGGFLKSARLGDKDILFTPFEIASGDAQVNIVISTNTASLEGEVDAAGADAARAGVVLAPAGRLHTFLRFYYSAPADGQGKFKLNGIAPGKYRIFALEKMAPANFRNPEAADKLEPLGEEIELVEGKTTEAHPKLIPQARAREALP